MDIKILLPFRVFAEIRNVVRIVVETHEGSYGLLPRRLDCVAALVPGIFTYETEKEGTQYLAINEGIMVKTGTDVLVSVRNAVGGTDLGKLHELVEKEFLSLNEQEESLRRVMSKIEVGFLFALDKYRKH